MRTIERLNDRLAALFLTLAAAGLVAMTAIIGWQVYARYVLNDTPHWSERLSLLTMLYYILFGAAVGVRTGQHLGLTFATRLLPEKAARAVYVLAQLLVIAFGLFMAWYGTSIMLATWSHSIPTLGISTGWSYLPFPVGGLLIALFALEHAARALGGEPIATIEPAAAAPARRALSDEALAARGDGR